MLDDMFDDDTVIGVGSIVFWIPLVLVATSVITFLLAVRLLFYTRKQFLKSLTFSGEKISQLNERLRLQAPSIQLVEQLTTAANKQKLELERGTMQLFMKNTNEEKAPDLTPEKTQIREVLIEEKQREEEEVISRLVQAGEIIKSNRKRKDNTG